MWLSKLFSLWQGFKPCSLSTHRSLQCTFLSVHLLTKHKPAASPQGGLSSVGHQQISLPLWLLVWQQEPPIQRSTRDSFPFHLQGSPIHSKFLCAGIFSSILRLQTFFTPAPFFYPLMLPVGLTFYITLPLAWRKLWLTSLHCCLLKILCWFAPLKCRLYLLRRCKDHSRTKHT